MSDMGEARARRRGAGEHRTYFPMRLAPRRARLQPSYQLMPICFCRWAQERRFPAFEDGKLVLIHVYVNEPVANCRSMRGARAPMGARYPDVDAIGGTCGNGPGHLFSAPGLAIPNR